MATLKQYKGSVLGNNWELEKGSKFKKLFSKFGFQKLNKILINQARFFEGAYLGGAMPPHLGRQDSLISI